MAAQHNTNEKSELTAISAPYNFVPLARWVYLPDWGRQVSHDRPFRDGYSGEIAYQLVAESPLLVGGRQKKSNNNTSGEVHPFELDGRYALPGSSLKGMLRAVVETAGFGRMRMVDDLRPGLRDISTPKVKVAYAEKARQVRPGLLRRRDDGGHVIVPCQMARLDHRDLEQAVSEKAPIFSKGASVAQKYERWKKLANKAHLDPEELCFELEGQLAKPRQNGNHRGVPVFTGQISDSTRPKGKRRDFIFYDPDTTTQPVPVPDSSWRDFLRIHGNDEKEKSARDMAWPGYWKQRYSQNEDIPVFYLQDNNVLRIGLAYMPKLAGDFSIYDMIDHSSKVHRQQPGEEYGYDLADLMFGAVGDEPTDALRGRVSCETAKAEGIPQARQQDATILSGPKPTYFPNYITQNADPKNGKLRSDQYATYMTQSPPPTLRGFKRYPARPANMTQVQSLNGDQKSNNSVQVKLHTLNSGTTFTGRIVFHNLRPVELGALLWTLTWGGNPQLHHSLGMGKSFGFGQVRFEIDHANSRLVPNDPAIPRPAFDTSHVDDLMKKFTSHMETVSEAEGDSWSDSPQIANLLAMADPQAANQLPKGMALRHMQLEPKKNINEFVDAKQDDHLVLADYAVACGQLSPEALGPEAEKARREKKARYAKAEQEKAAQHQREQEAAARQDELTKMDPVDRTMAEFLDARPDKNQPELNALLNALKQGHWESALQIEIARKVRQRMETEGKWKETSKKKNPKNDKNYQNTLLVMRILQDDLK